MIYAAAIVVHALIWQLWEPRLQAWGEKAIAWLTGKPVNQTRRFDADGVPVQFYRRHGLQYNPLFIAAQANRDYRSRADQSRLRRFRKLTDWLATHAVEEGEGLWLNYGFDLPSHALKSPWRSALTQACALSACARRYELEGDGLWLERCQQFLNTLQPGAGLCDALADGSLWFMEYPGPREHYVLNGMMGILLELAETARLTGLETAQSLFDRGYRALIQLLPEYDFHGFSRYDLSGRIASRDYHRTHVRQLRELNALRPDNLLAAYARRWSRADLLPVGLQLFFNPRPKRIAAFLLSLSLFLLLAWGLVSMYPR